MVRVVEEAGVGSKCHTILVGCRILQPEEISLTDELTEKGPESCTEYIPGVRVEGKKKPTRCGLCLEEGEAI